MQNFNLAERVKELRNRKGFSQELLADNSGLSLRTIQRIENNETIPRGDTLRRLAIVLDTTPDEIVDWKIQEDNSYLTVMNLTTLTFLFFPLLGILIPMIMWVLKKDKVKGVNELGKSIMNFQIVWSVLLFSFYILSGLFWRFFGTVVDSVSIYFKTILPLGILYAINIIFIIVNTVRVANNKKAKYPSLIRILR